MSNTPNLNLSLTPADDTTTTFKAWRTAINGTDGNSNMTKIDEAYGNLNKKCKDISEKMDMVSMKVYGDVKTWEDVRNAVRMGLAPKLFPVGYELTTPHSVMGNMVWVVVGHDHHTPANSRLTHSMTLEMKRVYGTQSTYKEVTFDAEEAMYYAETGLPAGVYHFTVANQPLFPADNGKSYQFTLQSAVPAGGQVRIQAAALITALEGRSVQTYASNSSTTVIETAVLTEGSGGTSLGTTNGEGNMNHMQRILCGSNNYAQSAIRQWLNSSAALGSVWTPQTKFDRPPAWHTSKDAAYAGFMSGFQSDFLDAVQPAVIPCRTNGIHEVDSLDGTVFARSQVYTLEDRFFLRSRPEIYGEWDETAYKDGWILEFYEGLSHSECKKYDAFGYVRNVWLRTPGVRSAYLARIINAAGDYETVYARNSYGVCAACIIA